MVFKKSLSQLEEEFQDCNRHIELDPNKAIELNPKYINVYFETWNLMVKMDRKEEALQYFNKTIEFNSKYPKVDSQK